MKQITPEDVPEYLNKDISSSIRHQSDEQGKYFDETKYEPVGVLNNIEWVMATKKGENKMLESVTDYGKLDLSNDFIELLNKLVHNSSSNESDVVKKGLVFLGLIDRVKQQGFKLAVVDEDGNLIANLEGY